jgi:hypothetical protein
VIGDLVAQRLRVEFADPPRREDCRFDAMRIEQLDEPPNSPFASSIGGSLSRRRSNIASKLQ